MSTATPARILKAGVARESLDFESYGFTAVQQLCDQYLAEAREQAQHILANAKAEAETLREQTLATANQLGFAQGMQAAEIEIEKRIETGTSECVAEQVETALPALRAAAEALATERDHWRQQWEESAIRVCAAIAERILRRELRETPELAQGMLTDVLELAAGSAQIEVRLNPRDLELLGQHGAEAQRVIDRAARCTESVLIPDPSVTAGGCVIETRHGLIDGRIESQLARIVDELVR